MFRSLKRGYIALIALIVCGVLLVAGIAFYSLNNAGSTKHNSSTSAIPHYHFDGTLRGLDIGKTACVGFEYMRLVVHHRSSGASRPQEQIVLTDIIELNGTTYFDSARTTIDRCDIDTSKVKRVDATTYQYVSGPSIERNQPLMPTYLVAASLRSGMLHDLHASDDVWKRQSPHFVGYADSSYVVRYGSHGTPSLRTGVILAAHRLAGSYAAVFSTGETAGTTVCLPHGSNNLAATTSDANDPSLNDGNMFPVTLQIDGQACHLPAVAPASTYTLAQMPTGRVFYVSDYDIRKVQIGASRIEVAAYAKVSSDPAYDAENGPPSDGNVEGIIRTSTGYALIPEANSNGNDLSTTEGTGYSVLIMK